MYEVFVLYPIYNELRFPGIPVDRFVRRMAEECARHIFRHLYIVRGVHYSIASENLKMGLKSLKNRKIHTNFSLFHQRMSHSVLRNKEFSLKYLSQILRFVVYRIRAVFGQTERQRVVFVGQLRVYARHLDRLHLDLLALSEISGGHSRHVELQGERREQQGECEERLENLRLCLRRKGAHARVKK